MSKQEKKSDGLKKLVKKVLTDKMMRNVAAMSAFVATVADVGGSWG